MDHRHFDLEQWLEHIQQQHWRTIDLKLDRIAEVWKKLNGKASDIVITVAGTNGKGSSVAMLASCLQQAGLKTGSYTSPHLVRYNERVCIDSKPVSDDLLIDAFCMIEEYRDGIPLTYFEFGTLCALLIFQQQKVDVSVLEVGMGGRLDAVNMVENDIALITSIGLDHEQWLGTDIYQIGREKAGVFKSNGQGVCAVISPPASIAATANERQTLLLQAEDHFHIFVEQDNNSSGNLIWQSDHPKIPQNWRNIQHLQCPFFGSHQVQNLSGVVATLALIANRTGMTPSELTTGLANAKLPGRCEVIEDAPFTVLDVAHNADSAEQLAYFLKHHPVKGKTIGVMGVLKDKDLSPLLEHVLPQIDEWYLATLTGERGQTAIELKAKLIALADEAFIKTFDYPVAAYQDAKKNAKTTDRIVIFGSFYTVGDIIGFIEST